MLISDEERQQGQLSDDNLNLALRSLREAGYIIIESVLPQTLIAERAAQIPSVPAVMPAGSLIVRDQCTGHSKAPNSTDQLRIMLAWGYFRAFQHYESRISVSDEILNSIPKRKKNLLRA